MTVITDEPFDQNLKKIVRFIATDSENRARAFHVNLRKGLESLDNFPFKYRQSIHYNDPKIRDFIFKGYTIPYLVDEVQDRIVVLDIFKWTER